VGDDQRPRSPRGIGITRRSSPTTASGKSRGRASVLSMEKRQAITVFERHAQREHFARRRPGNWGGRHESDVMKLARFQDVRVLSTGAGATTEAARRCPREGLRRPSLYGKPIGNWNIDERHAATHSFTSITLMSDRERLHQELADLTKENFRHFPRVASRTMVAADSDELSAGVWC